MSRFLNFLSKRIEGDVHKEIIFADFGPIKVPHYHDFLAISKPIFLEKGDAIEKKQDRKPIIVTKYNLADFDKLVLLGEGSFGLVYLVKNNLTGDIHAMKAILKKKVIEKKQVGNTRTEMLVLRCTNCPFHLRLQYFFKDNLYLFFVMPYMQGGELFWRLRCRRQFNESETRFYVAQVVLALEYLHFMGIVYRDLKLEHIMIDHTGYAKLADFGFCKKLLKDRTYTLCGTPEYIAPEVLMSKGYGRAVDWWSLGVLLYEMSAGYTPFRHSDPKKTYENILSRRLIFPFFFNESLRHLIGNLLQLDITARYGNMKNGVKDIKNHRWFRPLCWELLLCRRMTPPYIPPRAGPEDTRNFRQLGYKSLLSSKTEEYAEEFMNF